MPRKPGVYIRGSFFVTSTGGVQHQKLVHVSEGKKAAELALARLLVAREEARRTNGHCPTPFQSPPPGKKVGEALEEFLLLVEADKAPRTHAWYAEKMEPFKARFAPLFLSEITLKDGLSYKKWLKTEKEWVKGKEKKRGVSPTTANHYIRAAKTFLNWACKPSRRYQTGLMVNPWQEIKMDAEKGRERIITEEEFEHLLAQCDDGNVSGGEEEFREQLIVLRYTALRTGELREMRWGYLQFDLHRVVFPAPVTKTRRRREAVLIDRVEAVLLKRRERLRGMGARCGDEDYVFAKPGKNEQGVLTAGLGSEKLEASVLPKRFRRLRSRCVRLNLITAVKGGEHLVLHGLRHTRLSELCLEGHPLAIVQGEAGHTTPQMTSRYLHIARSQAADRIRAADAAREAAKKEG